MKKLIITSALISVILLPLTAEIEPKYYLQDQQEANEHLEIKVIDSDTAFCFSCRDEDITIEAEVIEVIRTASVLNKGDIITIKYSHFNPPERWVGPRPIPILQEGNIYPAFLNRTDDGYYVPAAGGYSFSPLMDYLSEEK